MVNREDVKTMVMKGAAGAGHFFLESHLLNSNGGESSIRKCYLVRQLFFTFTRFTTTASSCAGSPHPTPPGQGKAPLDSQFSYFLF